MRIAAQQQTDLIVVGVQGRGAASLMFFGSTTNHVVREATCPVCSWYRTSPDPCVRHERCIIDASREVAFTRPTPCATATMQTWSCALYLDS